MNLLEFNILCLLFNRCIRDKINKISDISIKKNMMYYKVLQMMKKIIFNWFRNKRSTIDDRILQSQRKLRNAAV